MAAETRNKYAKLRMRLFAESSVLLGVCAALGTGLYVLSSFNDDTQKKNDSMQAEVTGIQVQTTQLRDKYDKVRNNSALYQEALDRSSAVGLGLDRQALKEKFNLFKERFHLGNLHLTTGVIEELKDPKYKLKNDVMVSSDVNVDFEVAMDAGAYSLLDAMDSELPGALKINQFELTRQNKLSDDALHTLASRGQAGLLRGVVRFTWFGVKPIEAAEAPPPAGAAR